MATGVNRQKREGERQVSTTFLLFVQHGQKFVWHLTRFAMVMKYLMNFCIRKENACLAIRQLGINEMRILTESGERKRLSFVGLTLATSAGLLVAASLYMLVNEIREMKSDSKLPYSYLPIKLLYRHHSSHGADPFVIVGKDNTRLFVGDNDEKFMMDASPSSEALWGNNADHSPDFSKAKGFCLKVQLKMRQTGYEIVDMGIFPRGSIIRCPTTSPNLSHQA